MDTTQAEVERDSGVTRFLRDRNRWGLGGAKFGTYGTDISVCHYEVQQPGAVIFAVDNGGFHWQNTLEPAEARRIAAALLACADEAEQAAAVSQEAA